MLIKMDHNVLYFFVILVQFFSNIEGKVFHSHACEGNKMKMFCHAGDVIKVVRADYGRSNASVCQYYDDPNMVLNCHSETATDIVKKRCDGKLRCRVEATNGLFSDPCPGQIKYAEATYKCVSKHGPHAHQRVVKTFNHEIGAASKKREVKEDVKDVEEIDQSHESDYDLDSSKEAETSDELEISDDEDEIKPEMNIEMHQELKYIPIKEMDTSDIMF